MCVKLQQVQNKSLINHHFNKFTSSLPTSWQQSTTNLPVEFEYYAIRRADPSASADTCYGPALQGSTKRCRDDLSVCPSVHPSVCSVFWLFPFAGCRYARVRRFKRIRKGGSTVGYAARIQILSVVGNIASPSDFLSGLRYGVHHYCHNVERTVSGVGPLRRLPPQCANPRRYRVICESATRSLGDLIIFTSGQSDGRRTARPNTRPTRRRRRVSFGRRRFGPIAWVVEC